MKKMERVKDYCFETGMAITLSADQVRGELQEDGTYSRTHKSGWTITGEIHEDYVEWVNHFVATHPVYGQVSGDFEEEVHASTREAFRHFYRLHRPELWDYQDI